MPAWERECCVLWFLYFNALTAWTGLEPPLFLPHLEMLCALSAPAGVACCSCSRQGQLRGQGAAASYQRLVYSAHSAPEDDRRGNSLPAGSLDTASQESIIGHSSVEHSTVSESLVWPGSPAHPQLQLTATSSSKRSRAALQQRPVPPVTLAVWPC